MENQGGKTGVEKQRWKLIVQYKVQYKAGTSSVQERTDLWKQALVRGMVKYGGGVTVEGRSWKASVR